MEWAGGKLNERDERNCLRVCPSIRLSVRPSIGPNEFMKMQMTIVWDIVCKDGWKRGQVQEFEMQRMLFSYQKILSLLIDWPPGG